jgi:hypothetical protein
VNPFYLLPPPGYRVTQHITLIIIPVI